MTDKKSSDSKPKPEPGMHRRKDGNFRESSGSGSIVKVRKMIPPADMADLVEKGIAPELIPNWDANDPESNWYINVRKFTEERRALFLTKLEQLGRVMLAARHAGVSYVTINLHRRLDPGFDAACEEAERMYHEMCAASILHQARVGQIDERWDSKGNLLSRRVTYETKLREMLVKRADPSYNDVSKQEVAVVGGAVVVPAPVDSVESWEDVVKKYTGGADVGKSALDEGRVVKRKLVETTGAEVDGEEPNVGQETPSGLSAPDVEQENE